ncbi:conjugal transfer protein TraL [Vibrio cyclitrophicus]|uniref:conjugal transfer protein TraL n=1 Tax=Vibrio cyclitrophicus TaxID=47951 RepID=UPI0011130D62|nr:conjugal transfer protein TraL [Vibrio cyclitrophicus]
MKSFVLGFLVTVVASTSTYTPPVYAASQSDCSIWLCLPFGFPSGCSDAKKAFKKRVKRLKPPLPRLSSCLINGGGNQSTNDNITSVDGKAAYVPSYKVCNQWKERRYGRESSRYCVGYKTIPTHVVENTTCRKNYDRDNRLRSTTPTNCSQTIRYVRMLMDGKPYGATYYFDNNGNEFKVP